MTERLPTGIPKLYRRNFFESMSFGWMQAMLAVGIMPTESARRFMEFMNLDEDHVSAAALARNYYRMHREFTQCMREGKGKIEVSEPELELLASILEKVQGCAALNEQSEAIRPDASSGQKAKKRRFRRSSTRTRVKSMLT